MVFWSSIRTWADAVMSPWPPTHPLHKCWSGWHGSTSCLGPVQAPCRGLSTSLCLCHVLLDAEDAVLKWLLEAVLSLLQVLLPGFRKTRYQRGFLVKFYYLGWCAYAHTLPQMATGNHRHLIWKIYGVFLSFSFLEIFMFVAQRRWRLPISSYWQPQHLLLPFS